MRLVLAAVMMAAAPAVAADCPASPRAGAEALLAADRAFAAASARTDVVSGLSAMFDEGVIMPTPKGGIAHGKGEVVETLKANPANASSRIEWAPVRAGLSADGRQGFTFGFMTLRADGKPDRPLKYLAYWVKRPEGWRVAAYKRAGRPEGAVSMAVMEPALPAKLDCRAAGTAADRDSLDKAERGFSDLAQKVGVPAAFRATGRADAMNMGGEAGFTIGAEAIGGPDDGKPAGITWAPDDLLVAASGDLGVTWGFIRPTAKPGEEAKPPIPFFTVWKRDGRSGPWRYIAE